MAAAKSFRAIDDYAQLGAVQACTVTEVKSDATHDYAVDNKSVHVCMACSSVCNIHSTLLLTSAADATSAGELAVVTVEEAHDEQGPEPADGARPAKVDWDAAATRVSTIRNACDLQFFQTKTPSECHKVHLKELESIKTSTGREPWPSMRRCLRATNRIPTISKCSCSGLTLAAKM